MHEKRHFLSYWKCRHDAQIMWPYAYYITLGSHCKMANLSSKVETDTLPERPTRIQPYQSEPAWILKEYRYSMGFAKSHSLKCSLHKWAWCGAARKSDRFTQMGMMRCSKKVRSFELYKFNPLSPHCGSIAQELVHCYTWGHLRIVTVCSNTAGRHSSLFCRPHAYTVYWTI